MMPSKIMIFGIPGSGKSTFANQLGGITHLPVIHLDKYFYVGNWIERDYEEFLKIQKQFVQRKEWIIDGNATRSLEMRYSKADLVLYFKMNRLLCLYRIFYRLLFKDHRISDRAEGCTEQIRFKLIRYLWGFNKRVANTICDLRSRYPQVIFKEIKNKKEVRKLLDPYLT